MALKLDFANKESNEIVKFLLLQTIEFWILTWSLYSSLERVRNREICWKLKKSQKYLWKQKEVREYEHQVEISQSNRRFHLPKVKATKIN